MANPFGRRLTSSGGGQRRNAARDRLAAARSAASSRRQQQELTTLGDPDWLDRFINSQSQVPSAYAEASLLEAKQKAQRALTNFGNSIDGGRRKKLEEIAMTGTARRSNMFMNVLNVLDTPGELVRMAVADITGADRKLGGEIEFGDYWDAVIGNEHLLRERLGEKLVPDQFIATGSSLLDAAGADNPWMKGLGGFGLDVALDPLSWISFGALGAGKTAAVQAARATTSTALKNAAEAFARGAVDELLDPFEKRLGTAMIQRADEAVEPVMEALRTKMVKEGTALDDIIEDDLRFEARRITGEVEERMSRLAAGDEVADIKDYEWAREAYVKNNLGHGGVEVGEKIESYVARSKNKTLAAEFPDYINYEHASDFATGGMKIAFPFFRKNTPILATGMFRNDFSVRGVVDNIVSKIPGPAHEMVDSVVRRLSFESGELGLARAGKAWSNKIGQNIARQSLKQLGIGDEVAATVSSELTKMARTAAEENVDVDEMNRLLGRWLSSSDVSMTAHNLTSNPAMRKALDSAHQAVRAVTSALHHAARETGMEIGEVENYLPMMASKQYRQIVDTLAAQGVAIGPDDWANIADEELRIGYQLLSTYIGAAQEHRAIALANPGKPRYSLERVATGALYSSASDNLSLADMTHGVWRDVIDGTKAGYLSVEHVNNALTKALTDLVEKGRLQRKLPKGIKPFNENIAEVLDNYVATMTRSIHYRTYSQQLRLLNLATRASKRVHQGRTMAELFNVGKEGMDDVAEAIELAEEGRDLAIAAAVQTKAVAVAANWTIDVASVVADDPRIVNRLGKLQRRMETVERFHNETIYQQQAKAKKWIEAGVPEELADRLAAATTDGEVARFTNDILAIAEEKAALEIGLAQEIIAASPADQLDTALASLRQAERKADAIRRSAQATVSEMNEKWRARFRWRTTTEDDEYVFDLLGRSPTDGPYLRLIADEVLADVNTNAVRIAEESQRQVGAQALQQMVDRFTALNHKVSSLPNADIAEWLGVKPDSGELVADLLKSKKITLDDFENNDALKSLWIRSFYNPSDPSNAEAVFEAAKNGLSGLFSTLRTMTKPKAGQELLQQALAAMRTGNLEAVLSPALRPGVVSALRRVGFEDKWLEFGNNSLRYHPIKRQHLTQRVTLEDAITGLRELVPGGDIMPRDELLNAARNLDRATVANAPEKIRRFIRILSEDGLPIDIKEYEYVKGLLRLTAEAKAGIRQHRRVTEKMLANEETLNKALSRLTGQMHHVINGGTGTGLRRVWREVSSDIFKALEEHDYLRIQEAVDYMTGTARLGIGKQLMDRNRAVRQGGNSIWRPVEDALQEFNTWADNTAATLEGVVGAPFESAINDLRSFQLAWSRMIANWSTDFDTLTDNIYNPAFDAAFKTFRERATGARRAFKTVATDLSSRGTTEARQSARTVMEAREQLRFKPVKARTAEAEGFVSPTTAGIADDILEGYVVDRNVALVLENMANHIRSVGTPLGIRLLTEDSRAALRWWKAAATVGRPTFVPRNLIGGIFNGRIFGVGAREYRLVGRNVAKYRHAREVLGLKHADALAKVDEDFRPFMQGLLDSELLLSAHSTDIVKVTEGPAPWLAGATFNPTDAARFAPFRAGGIAMQKSEDFLRAAAFVKFYDPTRPETMDFAKQMALVMHFDYANLTPLEEWAKRFIPFFVWTRRNIPLQVRVMIENPGFINKYQHFVTNANAFFEDESVADQFEGSAYESGTAIETDWLMNEDTPFWARIIFDPDLPVKDLETFLRAMGNGEMTSFLTRMLHPGASSALNVVRTSEYPDVNAPSGLRELLMLGGTTQSGDVQVPYAARQLFNTTLPFLQEWLNVLTVMPSDPRQQSRLGVVNEDEVSLAERIRSAALVLGRAAGVRVQTPSDELGPAAQAKDFVDDLLRDLELEGTIVRDR